MGFEKKYIETKKTGLKRLSGFKSAQGLPIKSEANLFRLILRHFLISFFLFVNFKVYRKYAIGIKHFFVKVYVLWTFNICVFWSPKVVTCVICVSEKRSHAWLNGSGKQCRWKVWKSGAAILRLKSRLRTVLKVPILQVVLLFRMQLWPVAHFFSLTFGWVH